MLNLILVLILVAILGLAAGYVYKAKKNGQKCIGCPSGGKCGKDGCSACAGTGCKGE